MAVIPHREHVALDAQPSSDSHHSPSHLCSQGPPLAQAQ